MNNTTELNNGLCKDDLAQKAKAKIKEMHLQGCPTSKISRAVRLKRIIVEKHIEELEIERPRDLDKEKAMDLWRVDRLLECWYPAATARKITMSRKDKNGEQILKKNVHDFGLKAAVVVLRLLDRRARLLGFDKKSVQESQLGDMTGEIPLEELEKRLSDEDRESLKGCFYE